MRGRGPCPRSGKHARTGLWASWAAVRGWPRSLGSSCWLVVQSLVQVGEDAAQVSAVADEAADLVDERSALGHSSSAGIEGTIPGFEQIIGEAPLECFVLRLELALFLQELGPQR